MSRVVTSKPTKNKSELLTYDDYLTFPDNDGIRKEIIEGELFMTPAPSTLHQLILLKLAKLLDDYVGENKLGTLLISPCDVIFSNINVFQPDILFVSEENSAILTDIHIKGAPDLIVEILSPTTEKTDRIYKKRIYEKFGVKEYWIVDPEEQNVEIYVLKRKKLQLFHLADSDHSIRSHLFQDLEIELQSIFTSKPE